MIRPGKKRGRRMKKKYMSAAAAVLLAVALLLTLCCCREGKRDDNTVSTPVSSREAKGRNYEDIVTKFETAGFRNVYAEPMGDLIIGFLNKSGEVDEVTVGGKSDFKKDSRYAPDTYVIVKYHSFPSSTESTASVEESSEEVLADTSDGMTGVTISSDELKKLSVKEAVSVLEEAGFVNIRTQPLRDLVVGVIHKDGEIEEISIGGDISFKSSDRFRPDVKIIIRYHSY